MTKIIIDCDPGHDDAIEMLLAMADEYAEILGICTVAGNQSLEKTTLNALKVIELAGRKDINVYPGSATPIMGNLITAPNIHGNTGLDGTLFREPTLRASKTNAIDFMHNVLGEQKNVVIVTTGPITNLAILLLAYPEVKKNIGRIVWMGGSYSMGNITPDAEFNAYNDPEALKIVLNSKLNFTMVTLDVTHRALFTMDDIKRIKNMDNKVSEQVYELLTFFYKTYEENFSLGGVPIHDACALAEALHPGIIKSKLLNVEVNTSTGPSRGRTIVDIYNVTGREKNALVSMDINTEGFKNYLFNMLEKYK